MNDDVLSILVFGYDPYSFVWPYFDYFYLNKWPLNNMKCYFISQKKSFESRGNVVNVMTNENDDFSKRIQRGLSASKTPYVLVLLEDYLIRHSPDTGQIQLILSEMQEEKLLFVQLFDFVSEPRTKKIKDGFAIRRLNEKNRFYSFNLQPGIWDSSFLMDFASSNRIVTPWGFEVLINQPTIRPSLNKMGCCFTTGLQVVGLVDKGIITYDGSRLLKKNNLCLPKIQKESFLRYQKRLCRNLLIAHCPPGLKKAIKRMGRKMGKKYYS